jgi:hypothetical protein
VATSATMDKPRQSFAGLWNISFGFFGIQIGFALQNANMSRIFQSLGSSLDDLPALWIAAPLTGLLVQPIVGHLSDKTWLGRLGRRRPYFLAGAILAALSLFLMPLAPVLLMAAILLWTLDASLNISMEPFRAFVGDMLRKDQHTAGYAVQTAFIGAGAVVGSIFPWLLDSMGVAASPTPSATASGSAARPCSQQCCGRSSRPRNIRPTRWRASPKASTIPTAHSRSGRSPRAVSAEASCGSPPACSSYCPSSSSGSRKKSICSAAC